jgi:hypothetical protein
MTETLRSSGTSWSRNGAGDATELGLETPRNGAPTVDGRHEHASAPARQELGPTRLLLSDLRVAWLLLDHARGRMIERLFGVADDQSMLVTIIALLVLAEAAHDRAQRMLSAPGAPTPGDLLLAGAGVRGLVHDLAGTSSDETPLLGTLITIAVVGGLTVPTARRAARATRRSAHRARMAFKSRYGELMRLRD